MSDFNSVLQLQNYFLDDLEFRINEDEYEENSLDLDPKFALDSEERTAHIRFEFIVEENQIYMSGALVGIFTYDETVDEELARELLVVNGVTILFPYLRAAISNVTNIANVPTITLPIVNVIDYLKEKYEQINGEQ